MSYLSIPQQKLWSSITLLILAAMVLIPEIVSTMTGISVGFEIPTIGPATVGVLVAILGALLAIDMLRK